MVFNEFNLANQCFFKYLTKRLLDKKVSIFNELVLNDDEKGLLVHLPGFESFYESLKRKLTLLNEQKQLEGRDYMILKFS